MELGQRQIFEYLILGDRWVLCFSRWQVVNAGYCVLGLYGNDLRVARGKECMHKTDFQALFLSPPLYHSP